MLPVPKECIFNFSELEFLERRFVETISRDIRYGFAVVRLFTENEERSLECAQSRLMSLIKYFGTPIIVYLRHGLWKQIGVDIHINPEKVGGTGFIPLHIDCANSTHPPDYVVFYCLRPDPLGGGESIIAPFSPALDLLTSTAFDELKNIYINEGSFYDLINIGSEFNPFPIISEKPLDNGWIRYTDKTSNLIPTNAQIYFDKFSEHLVSQAHRHCLRPGEAIILNQRLAAHGRFALGAGQQNLTNTQYRKIIQVFVRRSWVI